MFAETQCRRLVLVILCYLGLCQPGCGLAQAQEAGNQSSTKAPLSDQWAKTELHGCLRVVGGKPEIFSFDDREVYELSGEISALGDVGFKEVLVRGKEDSSRRPTHAFHVSNVTRIWDTPKAALDSSFDKPSEWRTIREEKSGIEFSYPDILTPLKKSEVWNLESNFAKNDNVVFLGAARVPDKAYADSGLETGQMVILEAPDIRDKKTCSEFEKLGYESDSKYRSGDILYTSVRIVGGGGGHHYTFYYFHTRQNGRCYELQFTVASHSPAMYGEGCTMAPVKMEDEQRIVDSLMARVAFFRPSRSPGD